MALPDPKELKKIAATCRKVGIKHFRCEGFEFTLTDEDPQAVKPQARRPENPLETINAEIASDSLSEEELLLWSVTDQADETKGTA